MRRLERTYGSPLLRTRLDPLGWAGVVVPILMASISVVVALDLGWPQQPSLRVAIVSLHVVVITGVSVVLLTRRAHRRIRRFQAGQCIECGHDLRTLEIDKCPKCGATALR